MSAVRRIGQIAGRWDRPLTAAAAVVVLASLPLPWYRVLSGRGLSPVEVSGWEALDGYAVLIAVACVVTIATAVIDRAGALIPRLLLAVAVYTLVLFKALDLPKKIDVQAGVAPQPGASGFGAAGREEGAMLAVLGALLIVVPPLVRLYVERRSAAEASPAGA